MDVVELTQAVEAMGAGEILLNCIDKDGTALEIHGCNLESRHFGSVHINCVPNTASYCKGDEHSLRGPP